MPLPKPPTLYVASAKPTREGTFMNLVQKAAAKPITLAALITELQQYNRDMGLVVPSAKKDPDMVIRVRTRYAAKHGFLVPVQGNWDSLPGVVAQKGVIRKVFGGKNSMITYNEIKPGTAINRHSHPHEQLTYIMSGKAEFVLGDEALTLQAGDVLLVPPDVPHALKVLGGETVLNMDVFSPIREDYL